MSQPLPGAGGLAHGHTARALAPALEPKLEPSRIGLTFTLMIVPAFMIVMRVVGWLGTDQSLLDTQRRYGPWLIGAFWVLLATGSLLVLAEPPREFDAVSFWLKMSLVALMVTVSIAFGRSVRRHDQQWETAVISRAGVKGAALATFLIWGAIIFLGRFIAYDTVWGRVFPGLKA